MYTQQSVKAQIGTMGLNDNTYAASCTFNDSIYLFWNGAGGDGIWYSVFDGTNWSPQANIGIGGIKEETTPTAVFFNNAIYLFWCGSGDDGIWFCSFNGSSWTGQNHIGGTGFLAGTSPSATVANNTLYVVWNGSGNDGMFYAATTDGQTFGAQQSVSVGNLYNKSSPCAVSLNNVMYLFWNGSGDNHIYYCYLNGNGTFSQQMSMPNGSLLNNSSPSVINYNNLLYAFWNGCGNDGIWYSTFDGITWSNQISIKTILNGVMGVMDNTSPNACLGPNDMAFLFWNGAGGDGIWYCDMEFYNTTWMSKLNNQMLISSINLPGTHDSASIKTTFTNPYITQNLTITQQLCSGIRLLDVRIQVILNSDGSYTYNCCHGNTDLYTNVNQFQSLPSLLSECQTFLQSYNSEFIVMLLRVDDWTQCPTAYQLPSLQKLSDILAAWGSVYNLSGATTMPCVDDIRQKVFLLNSIQDFTNNGPSLGNFISWPDATPGSTTQFFNFYVQDVYDGLSQVYFTAVEQKFNYYESAMLAAYNNQQPIINFGSATFNVETQIFGNQPIGPKPLINQNVLNAFGTVTSNNRKSKFGNFGWTFFDYTDNIYETNNGKLVTITQFIIDSNFNYPNFSEAFTCSAYTLQINY